MSEPITATLHDGRKLKFPAGTDPAVIQATVKRMLGQKDEPISDPLLDPILASTADVGGTIEARPLQPGVPLGEFSTSAVQRPRAPVSGLPPETIQPDIERKPDPDSLGAYLDKRTAVGAGGTIGGFAGGALGTPGGPGGITRGAVTGGGLGAAAGSALFDTVDQFLRSYGFFTKPTDKDAIDIGKLAVEEGLTDMVFSLGFTGIGRVGRVVVPSVLKGGRSLTGRLLGVANKEAATIVAKAQDLGVPLSAFDISPAAQTFAKVLGVFPFIGSPIRKQVAGRPAQIQEAAEDILNTIAPNTLMADLGVDLVKAAGKAYAKVRKVSGKLYGEYRSRAASVSVPDIFETRPVIEAAKSMEVEILQQITKTAKGEAGKSAPFALRNLIETWKELPERVTVEQMRGLKLEARRVLKLVKDKESKRRLAILIKAADTSLQSPRVDLLPEGEGRALVEALEAANSHYAREMPKFETATAKKMLLANKTLFSPGATEPGTKTADELARVFRNPTPQQVKELKAVASPKVMKRYARNVLQGAFEGAQKPTGEGGELVFDPFTFERALGLTGTDRLRREGFEQLLKGTPLKIDDLRAFVDVAKRASAFNAPQASTFLQRRIILGGSIAGGVMAGFGLADMGDAGLLSVGLMILAGRHASKIVSDPARLRAMTTLLDRTKSLSLRREAGKRVVRALVAPEPIVDVGFIGGS